jgi:phosphatidylserine/phosphatidylglycerophosphate/cardiolipin synthase-like enzyme/uncharacterized membrane protein YdjX (TVP38/TMEM64 family)
VTTAAVARAARDGETPAPETAIIQPGRNCWRVERANHFYCVQDAADYFRLVRDAILAARKTIFTLGWDTTAHTDLLPGASAADAPTRLDKLLAFAARRRPRIRVYILTWDYGSLYTLERDPLSRWRLGWRMPRQIKFGFDDHHPIGASHHQKIVVVDDQLAFCGGIDLTGHRWDTSAHRVDEPGRVTPMGKVYGPYHEVQAMVTGPAAASLGVLARDRWRALGADRLPAVNESGDDLWPADLTPDLTGVDVAIARTMPASGTQPAIRECEALFLDAIAQAKRTIYIESQYFTNDRLCEALGARLREPGGPEIVIVSPKECHGWLEQTTMGAFRDGVFRQLLAADAHRRLRLVYPTASRSGDLPTFIHSKVMIVDDELARIGSANFSRRSMGMDTECDLAVEARGNPEARSGIRRIRDRLVAEHLDVPVDAVAPGIAREGSLRAFVDAQAHGEHTLLRIELPADPEPPPSEALRAVADPDAPAGLGTSAESAIPSVEASNAPSALRIWILPGVVLAAAALVAWTTSASVRQPELQAVQRFLSGLPGQTWSVWIGVAVFVAAGLVLVPLELLSIAAGVLLGGIRGGLVAAIGSFAAATAGYLAGRAIGLAGLRQWMSRRAYRSGRQLGAQGVGGVIVLRLSSVASAGSVHLLCGAARTPFAAYLAGTVIGLAPSVAALSWLGAWLRRTVLDPSIWNGLISIGAGVLVLGLAAALRAFLLIRQFAPSMSSHRDRAEFG